MGSRFLRGPRGLGTQPGSIDVPVETVSPPWIQDTMFPGAGETALRSPESTCPSPGFGAKTDLSAVAPQRSSRDLGRRRIRPPSGTGPTSRDIGRRKEERSLSGIAGLHPAGVTSLPPVAGFRPAPRGALVVALGIPGGDVLPLVGQF